MIYIEKNTPYIYTTVTYTLYPASNPVVRAPNTILLKVEKSVTISDFGENNTIGLVF